MTNEVSTSILAALDIAAFERRDDGSFASIGALPDWFSHLAKDQTFPFLATFLEEAGHHWNTEKAGRLRSGLCVEVDDLGREFHFEVSAITGPDGQFLVFERPAAAEHLRTVLQRAREQALDHAARARSHAELQAAITTLELHAQEARRAGRHLVSLAGPLPATGSSEQSRSPALAFDEARQQLLSVLDAIVEGARMVGRTFEQS